MDLLLASGDICIQTHKKIFLPVEMCKKVRNFIERNVRQVAFLLIQQSLFDI